MIGPFPGFIAWETGAVLWQQHEAMFAGLLIGTATDLATMIGFWLVTWPFRGLFLRFPVLRPLLIGASFGVVLARRYAVAEQVPFGQELGVFTAGGAVALAVTYLRYRLLRRLFAGRNQVRV